MPTVLEAALDTLRKITEVPSYEAPGVARRFLDSYKSKSDLAEVLLRGVFSPLCLGTSRAYPGRRGIFNAATGDLCCYIDKLEAPLLAAMSGWFSGRCINSLASKVHPCIGCGEVPNLWSDGMSGVPLYYLHCQKCHNNPDVPQAEKSVSAAMAVERWNDLHPYTPKEWVRQ